MTNNWTRKCYSRLLIDNHITEDDAAFMTEFDSEQYVKMVKMSGVESAMVYACCHNGNCYYPTQVGHMHKNLHGIDIFGQVVTGLKNAGIAPIAYYTVIFHNDTAKLNPQWRITDAAGQQNEGRYWWCCPNNSDAVSFFMQQIDEIIEYDIDGIFIDMTFWPKVCCCENCRKRYLKETGEQIPLTIDWNSSIWVNFQRSREKWLAEFAQSLTEHIKKVKPQITVTHQFAPVLIGWSLGQSEAIAASSDYPSGDFYGGKNQQRLGVKVMNAFRHNDMPFEFMTSRCINLWDHTSIKSEEELYCSAVTTLAHGGACFFIDAINPDGTLEPKVYRRLGQSVAKIKSFTNKISELHPSLLTDVGVYFSMSSHNDEYLNGLSLKKLSLTGSNMTHDRFVPTVSELVGTSINLGKANIPYKIITPDSELEKLSTLIINNAKYMSPGEVERIRQFVAHGGTLIATGQTSLCDLYGDSSGDFALADVLGVSYSGRQAPRVNYLYDGSDYLVSTELAPLINAKNARSLAKVVLPYFDPDDTENYASIHSNPPGRITDFAALTVNTFGKGKCIYLYSSILGCKHDAHQQFVLQKLLRPYVSANIIEECNAPACVEVTLLRNEKFAVDPKYLLCFVNWQEELPNIPVNDIQTVLKLPQGYSCEKCTRVSDGGDVSFGERCGMLTLDVSRLDSAEFFEITLKNRRSKND